MECLDHDENIRNEIEMNKSIQFIHFNFIADILLLDS